MANGDPDTAPLVPGNTPSPDVNQQAQTGGLADQWRSWMADPHNRAAMIQFGVALSQPISAGQNALGQIGSAVGQAGEASDRITAEQQKEEELASKQDLRSAQATAAEEKAKGAGNLAAFQQDRLALQRQGMDLADQKKIADAYNKHLQLIIQENKEISARNFIKKKGEPQEPLKTPLAPEEFASRYRGMGATGNVAPVAAPAGTAASGAAPTPVQTPDDVAKLSSGTRYVTPDGRTGTAP